MPRPASRHLPRIPQHVTQRGNNRQACFHAEDDYRLYLDLLLAACREHACALHAYVLMTNHVHLLLTPECADGISLVIRDVGRDYVRTINKAYRRTGTLWEGRYKSSLVDQTCYCLACYRHIELNPVRAGMVRCPEDYPWISYRCNATGEPDSQITPHDCWLALGGNDYDMHTSRGLIRCHILARQAENKLSPGTRLDNQCLDRPDFLAQVQTRGKITRIFQQARTCPKLFRKSPGSDPGFGQYELKPGSDPCPCVPLSPSQANSCRPVSSSVDSQFRLFVLLW